MRSIKISIVTVSFNGAETIRDTIESVLNQTYSDIEYIVVDGNSSDNTLDIIKEYEPDFSGRMHWVSEPDKGLYDAMNKGIHLATGDFVGILNSDDTFFNTEVIEVLANFHQQNDLDASVGNIVQHSAEGKLLRIYSAKNWSPQKLKIGFMPPHPSIFFKRELFEKLGYYHLDFVISADYELIVRFFLKHKIIWRYSGITTTTMLVGGLSSSGYKSYQLISQEIVKALRGNRILFSPFKVRLRGFWKVVGLFNKSKI